MFSSVFVDRPRLAIVIAIVTTIAGLLVMMTIPLAQYPDIVPPQVSVTTFYPGANSKVVDATVAQPIEAQVVGVDKAIYMKSVSGDDGSYTLTVSFELGTNPDINAVNVNNRVQVALAQLPPEVQKNGITVKKKSSALLGVIAVSSPKGSKDPLFLSNFVTINLLDQIRSTPGVGDATLWGPQDYAMRAWVHTNRLTGLGLTTADVISAIQSQNAQAAVGRIGARPIANDQQLQLNIQTKGRLTSVAEFENIVIRTGSDGSILRLKDIARVELGAANLDRDTWLNGAPAAAIAIYQNPGANALTTLANVIEAHRHAGKQFSRRGDLEGHLRPDGFRHRHHSRSPEDPDRGLRSRGSRGVSVPRQRARDADSDARRARQPGRRLHRAERRRRFRQYRVAGRHRAGHRHCRRRRHRRGRECRARHGGKSGPDATGGHQEGHGGNHRADHRHHAGADVGFRSDRLHSRHFRRIIPPVCGHRLRRHGAVGDQRPDLVSGLVRRALEAPSWRAARRHRLGDARHRLGARPLWRRRRPTGAHFGDRPGDGRRCGGRRRGVVRQDADRLFAGGPEDDQGALFVVMQLPGGASLSRTNDVVRQAETILKQEDAIADVTSVVGLNFIDSYSQPNAAFSVVTLKPFEERGAAEASASAIIKLRFPTKPDAISNIKPDTFSDLKPDSVPI